MIQRTIVAAALSVFLVVGTASAGTRTVGLDTIGDAPVPATDIVSSSRVSWREAGVRWIRFSMRFDAGNNSIYSGRIRLDVDGDELSDARISFSHWDNGPRPDGCSLRIDGRWRNGRAASNSPTNDRFRCTIRRGWLPAQGPIGWAILLRGDDSELADRAPDVGWFR